MSIPPVNKPSDYDKFFNRYLADLALQVKLNQENYDANVAFFKTGVQATERTDSRSIEQRSTDVETLKIQARTMLNKLTDSNSASEVLTFLINNNLLFFFVQNFVDFERTINKRYPSQTASAPILRVLIQKSFEKQNQEIPLLKDELIVTTNSVASREIMKKVLTDVYERSDTNVILYETIRDNLNLFPTLQEKLEIVKFPEKKFKDEEEIMFWKNLPTNKTIEQLLDLYEQLYNGEAENIQSTQNQINNIENSIETQFSSFTNMRIKSKLDESKVVKRLATQKIEARTADYERKLQQYEQDILAAEQERKLQQYKQSKAGQKEVVAGIKDTFQKSREYDEQRRMDQEEYLQKEVERLNKEELRRLKYPGVGYKMRTTKEAPIEASDRVRRVAEPKPPSNKGSFKFEEKTIEPISYMTLSKSAPKPRGNLKPNVAIQEPISAEPLESELYLDIIPSKKVKSAKAKEEPRYANLDQDLYQEYLDQIPTEWKLKELKEYAKKNYNIIYTKLKEETGDSPSESNLRKFIATQQYFQANKYKYEQPQFQIPIKINPAINELTRGSYSDKVFIPDPNASISRQPPMEGTGLLTKRQQDSHRFKVLQGQILAGNNSKKIVMELKALILKMNKLGEISNKKATAVLQELNSVLK